METLRFLNKELAYELAEKYGSPIYVYSEQKLDEQIKKLLAFPNPFGITVRFAMKSCPTRAILQHVYKSGLHIDASSVYECYRAMAAGIPANKISLSSQELAADFSQAITQGVQINACSLSQLERYGQAFPETNVGVRLNPGLGSGGTFKTNVGGPASSFGIWHELIPQIKEIAQKYKLKINKIHTHIGSGSDPDVWQRIAIMSLNVVKQFPEVTVLNLGGGYKVARMQSEKETDLQVVGKPVADAIEYFAQETGRKLYLEIEPGTYLTANSASLITTIQDYTHTGKNGYEFLKTNSGMTEILRPSLYGAQHPIITLPRHATGKKKSYVIVGHCCESGDLLSCAPDDPEALLPRELNECQIGDLCVIEGAGAYCSSMSSKNYNSFPEAAEVFLLKDGSHKLIRKRQSLEQMTQNEI